MKTKVLFTINNLEHGGAQRSLIELLNAFDFDQFDVSLLVLENRLTLMHLINSKVEILDNLDGNYFGANLEFIRQILSKGKYFEGVLTFIKLFFATFTRKNIHYTQRYWDIKRCFIPKHQGTYDIAIAYLQGIPTYYTIDKVKANKKIIWFHSDYISGKYSSIIDFPYFMKADYIIGVSEQASINLRLSFPEIENRIKTIYNKVPINDIYTKASEFQVNSFDGLRILSVGRIDPVKRYEIQIDAAELLKASGIAFEWIIIGGGKILDHYRSIVVKKELDKYVKFVGQLENPYPYFSDCDIYVQTSSYESYCLSIAEAKIFQKNIISTHFTGIEEHLTNYKNGIIIADSEQILAETILLFSNQTQICVNNIFEVAQIDKFDINQLYELF